MEAENALNDFPIVCLGGATLDLAEYVELIKNLPADSGAAVVVIDHVKGLASRVVETLAPNTKMPVVLITENLPVQPNCVFVIPDTCDLHSGWDIPSKAGFEAPRMDRCGYDFSALADEALEGPANRCHSLRSGWRRDGGLARHQRSWRYYYRAES